MLFNLFLSLAFSRLCIAQSASGGNGTVSVGPVKGFPSLPYEELGIQVSCVPLDWW